MFQLPIPRNPIDKEKDFLFSSYLGAPQHYQEDHQNHVILFLYILLLSFDPNFTGSLLTRLVPYA